ncbi:MAG: hypothetical protein Q4C70_05970 [Planctomycetia bacterium]|nr:hypothetical protein [Planctomycetia bacterium]
MNNFSFYTHRFFISVFVFLFLTGTVFAQIITATKETPEIGTEMEFFTTDLADPAEELDVKMSDETVDYENAENEDEIPSLDTIQDYWRLYEVSDSFRNRYTDGEAWLPGEDALFFFYHLKNRIRLERLESWALPDTALVELDLLTEKLALNARRFDAFWVSGKLLSAEKTALEERVAFRYDVDSYYTCRLILDDGRRATLFCHTIPRAFQKPGVLTGDVKTAPRVGVIALFMKKGPVSEYVKRTENVRNVENADSVQNAETEQGAGSVQGTGSLQDAGNAERPEEMASLFLLGNRLAWYPDTLLGNAGMDYGLFDDLDRTELPPEALRSASADTRLSLRNRECFYQLMNTVFRMPPEKLQKIVTDVQENAPDEHFEQLGLPEPKMKDGKRPTRYSSVAPLFNQPVKERGNFFYVKGVARRIVAIRVEDADINNRFGITHYYEIFMFPDETPQSPIVVLTPELPPGVQPGNDRGYYVELAVPAFFFNTWGYIKGENEEGKPIRRLSPLLIGGIPKQTVSTVYTPDLMWFYVIGISVFGGMFIFSTIFYFMSSRADQEYSRNRQRMHALPEGSRFENEVEKMPETEEIGFEQWCENVKKEEEKIM